MTIQSQLDQVLAPCPFCGTSGPRHCTTKDEYGRPSYGVQCVGGECAIVGPQAGSQVAAAEKWNRQHGPAIRAAVGGDAVAWRMLRANGKQYTGWRDLPVPEWAEIEVADGMRLEYAYASHPATVDVGALLEFIARERDKEYRAESALAVGNLLDELAALIAEAANAPSAGSIGKEA